MSDQLMEVFENLNEIETLLSKDNIEEFKKRDLIYTEHMTEICAFFGSDKCLCFLDEQGVELSPLINLYSIMRDNKLSISIPHEDELFVALKYNRPHRVQTIEKPHIRDALRALLFSLGMVSFDIDYAKAIYERYEPSEWSSIISGKTLRSLILFNHPLIFKDLRLNSQNLFILLKENPDVEIDDERLPEVFFIRKGKLDDYVIDTWKGRLPIVVRGSSKMKR